MPECATDGSPQWYTHLARYGKMVFFPREPQCFAYSVLEAYLLGLEVEVSGRIGVESFDCNFDELVDRCSHSGRDFWDMALNALP